MHIIEVFPSTYNLPQISSIFEKNPRNLFHQTTIEPMKIIGIFASGFLLPEPGIVQYQENMRMLFREELKI